MKKNYLSYLSLGLLLAVSSCNIEQPTLDVSQEPKTLVEIVAESNGSENLRKAPNGVFYQEKFSNQSIAGALNVPEYAFPGFGIGNSTYMGKAYSYFNQYIVGFEGSNVAITMSAPVTEFFSTELADLGLDIAEIDANNIQVSSLSTDGKGNAIWFHNEKTTATFLPEGGISFEATISIVGGSGIFKNATGEGTVIGNVGTDGKGSTVVRANIKF